MPLLGPGVDPPPRRVIPVRQAQQAAPVILMRDPHFTTVGLLRQLRPVPLAQPPARRKVQVLHAEGAGESVRGHILRREDQL